jgi:hypothetical protein
MNAAANPVRAVAAWHDALAGSDQIAGDSAAWLIGQLARRGLFFGDRPLCTTLRPRFLSPEQQRLLWERCGTLLRALSIAFDAAMAEPKIFDQFRAEAWESELIHADPDSGHPNALGRIDAFFNPAGSSFWLTEFNGETPAGQAYSDELAEIFMTMPVMRSFLQGHRVFPLRSRHGVLHTLLDSAAQAGRGGGGGGAGGPIIAIGDWREVPTQSEFRLFREYFAKYGLQCLIADPDELEYSQGRLAVGGVPIDVVYKRVLLTELIGRHGIEHPLVRATRDGAVTMVNGFRAKLLHKKASLAVLSDERNARLFDAATLAVIAAHVPWTRVVEKRQTQWKGNTVDLLDLMTRERERFVLKPNDDYGGQGIVLGWEVDSTVWDRAVGNALDGPWIVQERIELPWVTFPGVTDGKLTFTDRLVDTAPFAFGGTLIDGCLTRVSSDSLVNVTAGGGSTLATFVVEECGR